MIAVEGDMVDVVLASEISLEALDSDPFRLMLISLRFFDLANQTGIHCANLHVIEYLRLPAAVAS